MIFQEVFMMFRMSMTLISICMFTHALMAQDRMEETMPSVEDFTMFFSKQLVGQDGETDSSSLSIEERQKTILSINTLLQKGSSETETVLLQRKLALAYLEQHQALRKQSNEKYKAAYKQWNASGHKTEEPQLVYDNTDITNAANTFRDIVNKSPKHLVRDEDMFNLVLSLARIGSESAPNYYKMMFQRFPESKYALYTKIVLADYYLKKGDYSSALGLYKEVSEKKDSPTCAYAFYKMGWAHFALRAVEKEKEKKDSNAQKSIIALKLAGKLVEKEEKYQGAFNLKEETLKDLSHFWAVFRDVDTAKQYFEQEKQREYFFKTLEKLAQIYGEEGNYQKGVAIIEQLIREDPVNLENPRRYLSLIQYREASGLDPSFVASDLERMKTLFIGQTTWTKANIEKQEKIKEAEELLEQALSGYVAAYHQEGVAGKKPYLAAAVKIYELFLSTFPKSDKSYDFRYYMADLLVLLRRLDEAATHYFLVSQEQPKTGKHLKDAAFNAIACMNEIVNTTQFPETPPPYSLNSPLEIPPVKQKFIKMMDNFITLLPQDEQTINMRYFAAETLFQYGHFNAEINAKVQNMPEVGSITRYRDLIFKSPSSEQAVASIQQLFEYYKARKMFLEGVTLAKDIFKAKLAIGKEATQYVTAMYQFTLYQLAVSLSQQKKFRDAGERFLEYQTLFPTDESASLALSKSFENFLSAGALDRGIVAASLLLRDYPTSPYKPDALLFLASANEKITNFAIAAQKYGEFANSYPRDPRTPDTLAHSARLSRAVQKNDLAMTTFSTLITNYPSYADTTIYFDLADLQEQAKLYDESHQTYEKYLQDSSKRSSDDIFYAQAKIAETLWKSGSTQNREKSKTTAKILLQKLPENKTQAFKARARIAFVLFTQTEEGREELMKMPLKAGPTLKADLSLMQKRLEELAGQYETVAKIGVVEFSLGALFRIGDMYEKVSEKMLTPINLANEKPEAKLKMTTEIDKIAIPLKSEAEKYYLLALKLAKKSTAITAWTGNIYDRLSKLKPEQYKPVDAISLEPTYVNHTFTVSEQVASLTKGL